MTEPPLTFACLHTPPGRGGIAVISLCGPGAAAILQHVFVPRPSHAKGGPGGLQLGHLADGGQRIDEAIVHQLGDLAEINIHGGPAAAQATLEALQRHGAKVGPAGEGEAAAGLGAAHPAWANPAIGAELLAVLPQAPSIQVVAALTQQWSGGISALARRCMQQASAADAAGLAAAAQRLAVARRLLSPAEVVLAGPPNAGKSTLANVLAGRAVSIVHDTAGTTRDWVRELALLEGLPVWLTDTAGLWQRPGGPGAAIEREAVNRAMQCVRRADLVVLLGEVDDRDLGHAPVLRVHAKCDVAPAPAGALAICAHTGEGLAQLKREILLRLGLADFDPAVPMAFTGRQAKLLSSAAAAIEAGKLDAARASLGELLG